MIAEYIVITPTNLPITPYSDPAGQVFLKATTFGC